jgi:transposase-like protein
MCTMPSRAMNCVYCQSKRVVKKGKDQAVGQIIQRYRCNHCGRRFNERSGTPIARLRTSAEVISLAMRVRSEGLGIRATGRVLGKSGGSIINWEKRLSEQLLHWSPSAPEGGEVPLEGDEVYTRVGENLSPRSVCSHSVAEGIRMDNPFYRADNSLWGRSARRVERCIAVRERRERLGLG